MQSGKFIFLSKSIEFTRPKTTIVVDRDRAGDLGISMQDIGRNLSAMLGGGYVNWFNLQGRSYKVIPQVERRFRLDHGHADNYYLRGRADQLLPLSTLVSFKNSVEPSEPHPVPAAQLGDPPGHGDPGRDPGRRSGLPQGPGPRGLPRGLQLRLHRLSPASTRPRAGPWY